MAESLDDLRVRHVRAARQAAQYLERVAWEVTRDIDAARTPVPRPVLKAAAQLHEALAALEIISYMEQVSAAESGAQDDGESSP